MRDVGCPHLCRSQLGHGGQHSEGIAGPCAVIAADILWKFERSPSGKTDMAMEIGLFLDDLPIKSGAFSIALLD